MNFKIFSLYWDNADPEIVAAQRAVFDAMDLPICQHRLDGMDPAEWMDWVLTRNETVDVFLFIDIDCIPLSRQAVWDGIEKASAGTLYGCEGLAGSSSLGSWFLFVGRKEWEQVGRPPAATLSRSWPQLWKAAGLPVQTIASTSCGKPSYDALGLRKPDGTGTGYGNICYHLFGAQGRDKALFIGKSQQVLANIRQEKADRSGVKQPLFTVAICTYRRYDKLPLAIDSVLKQDMDPSLFDIFVIDNSPSSPERTAFRKKYDGAANLSYIEVDTPGLSNARNIAMHKSTAQWIVFLDDDAVAVPELLSRYRDVVEQYGDDLGAIGGRIDPAFEADRPSWLGDELLYFLSVCHVMDQVGEYPSYISPIGANMALRRDLMLAAGGFDVTLGRNGANAQSLLSGEETNLFRALHAAKKKIVYTPFARVAHLIPPDRLKREWFRRRFAWQGVSDVSMGGTSPDMIAQMWGWLIQYFNSVPPENRALMGLFWDTTDPVAFARQVISWRYLTHLILSQGKLPE